MTDPKTQTAIEQFKTELKGLQTEQSAILKQLDEELRQNKIAQIKKAV
jgi:hypothetical protein